jgi:hypothetical protein
MIWTKTSHNVSDLAAAQAGPAERARYIRGHWGIEDRRHFVRERTFDKTDPGYGSVVHPR